MKFFCFLLVIPFFGMAQGVTTYDRTAWTITASSEALIGEGAINGRVGTLIDGNNQTFWSSRWASGTVATFPHTLVFDMKVAQPVNQLYYVPRNSYNSVPTVGSVSFGDDGINFGPEIPVTFATKFEQAFINLPTVQNRRYFRLTLTQNQATRDNPAANNPTTTMAEVGAMLNPAFSVILTAFKAEPETAAVKVSWATTLEQNRVGYTLTRSADALNFAPVSNTVAATGSPTTASSYTITDPAPLTGVSFYRLEVKNNDGSIEKSPIITTEYPAVVYTSDQPKNVNIFYFIPSDVVAVPDFKARLDTILVRMQTFFGNEMQRNGRGYKTFGLATDPTHKRVKINVVNGKLPFASYPYQGGGAVVLPEVQAYMTANPSAFYGSHSLILLPAFSYDPVSATIVERVPFYGSGKNCFALDYADQRQSLLGVNTAKGNLATVYIGGMAHEMGHGLNLPHNRTKVSEVALGTLLMGNGNYTYGKTATSLSAADAAILNNNQVFNDGNLSYYGPLSATITSLHAFYSPAKKAIIITGRVASAGSPVTDVTVYNDPAPSGGNLDYDALTWQTPVFATDSFYVEEPVSEFQVNTSSAYQLKIKLVQRDGNTPEFYYTYNFVNSVPDIAIGAPIFITAKPGAWNDTSVWLCGVLPTAGAVVTVKHEVTIPASYVSLGRKIQYDAGGRIIFEDRAKLRTGQ
jgi:F5/8 type C domain